MCSRFCQTNAMSFQVAVRTLEFSFNRICNPIVLNMRFFNHKWLKDPFGYIILQSQSSHYGILALSLMSSYAQSQSSHYGILALSLMSSYASRLSFSFCSVAMSFTTQSCISIKKLNLPMVYPISFSRL